MVPMRDATPPPGTMKYHRTHALILSAAATLTLVPAAEAQRRDRDEAAAIPVPRTRPQRHFDPPARGGARETEFPAEFRSIDGEGNHLERPGLGAAEQPMPRFAAPAYADGVGSPGGTGLPSARAISNALAAQHESIENRRGASDFLWQWGQFLDHDIVETPAMDPAEPFDIAVPAGDPWFDPEGTGEARIPLNRSLHEQVDGVRQQINGITAFIDASNVYGSDQVRAYALRRLDGSGKLKTSRGEHGELLPYNVDGLSNAPGPDPRFFLAGDVRANEQAALTAMHTLFVREHNHWAEEFRKLNPASSGDEIYEFARMIVGAEMQRITYEEFLPVLLGPDALPRGRGYDARVDPSIRNEFATAGYRFGHSLLSATLRRIDRHGETIEAGDLPLARAFFNPALIEAHGIDPLLRGLAVQRCQELDAKLVDAVRNLLFGPPGAGGFDLAALNIQRGRDHGLASYNALRRALGMTPRRSFRELAPDRETALALQSLYGEVDAVDAWVGCLCERHAPGAMVGPTLQRLLVRQFTALRDGDRFFYRRALDGPLLELVEDQTLARIIRRNTGIGRELQKNVFLVRDGARRGSTPGRIPSRR